MLAQVALTAIGIPVAMEGVNQVVRTGRIRAEFPTREYLAAHIDVDPPFEEQTPSALEERRARLFAELERRVSQEPGVVAVTFASRVPGSVCTDTLHSSGTSRLRPATQSISNRKSFRGTGASPSSA